MRVGKRVLLTVLFLIVFSLPCSAQTVEELYNEQLEASGGEMLLQSLPEETKVLLDKLGISSLQPETFSQADTEHILHELLDILLRLAKGPIASATTVLGIVLLYAWVQGLGNTLGGGENTHVFGVICALTACGTVLLPISACITRVCEAMESVSVFMTSFVPVYAGVLITGGKAVSALSFQSLVLYASELLSLLSTQVIVPLMTASLALGLCGSVSPHIKLGKIGELISKSATWLLTLAMVLFTGLLSLQNLAGTAADTLGNRALKFSIASFVPVVGGTVSEAFSTVRGCLHLLKSTIGCFGMAATALVVLPPLATCLIWNGVLALCHMTSEMFELAVLSGVLKSTQSVLKCLIAVLSVSAVFMIIAVTVVTMATAG